MAGGHPAMALSATHVLVVAGCDCSGGAGIARDVETIAAFGLRTALAVTALTVQTHGAVDAVVPAPPELVEAQMRAALAANRVAAVKIGLLATAANVEGVARVLADHPRLPVVLDPVAAASAGRPLLAAGALEALRLVLMPRASLLTPNLPELALLAGGTPEAGTAARAGRLLALGVRAVLVKGGHAKGARVEDRLFRPGLDPRSFAGARLSGSLRGTGCMLSSAIAAGLARGERLEESIAAARGHVAGRWMAEAPAEEARGAPASS